ncbi:deoxyribodipyrimidine photo-lyase, partial [Rhodovulum sulfidophilum]|nr:deoxyribodipyrimidine photo-lyase [Rhodovulum sulfidophilum]
MSDQAPVIWWVRRDLRLGDNAALAAAAGSGRPV